MQLIDNSQQTINRVSSGKPTVQTVASHGILTSSLFLAEYNRDLQLVEA